jgi:hypothetical protein
VGFNQALRFTGYEAARESVTRQMLIGSSDSNTDGVHLTDLLAANLNQAMSTINAGYASAVAQVSSFSPGLAVSSLVNQANAGYTNALSYAKSTSTGELVGSVVSEASLGTGSAWQKLSNADVFQTMSSISTRVSSLAQQILSINKVHYNAPASPKMEGTISSLGHTDMQTASSHVHDVAGQILAGVFHGDTQLLDIWASWMQRVLGHTVTADQIVTALTASNGLLQEAHGHVDPVQLGAFLSTISDALSRLST